MIGISLKNSPAHSLSPPEERAPRRRSEPFARRNVHGCQREVAGTASDEPYSASRGIRASPGERSPVSGRSIRRGRIRKQGEKRKREKRQEGEMGRERERERERKRGARPSTPGIRSRLRGGGDSRRCFRCARLVARVLGAAAS